jgi:hypothetical protein
MLFRHFDLPIVNLQRREYSLSASHEFSTILSLYLAKSASYSESKRMASDVLDSNADAFWAGKQSVLLRAWATSDYAYFQNRVKFDKPIEKTQEGEYPRRLQLAETGM